MPKMRSLCQESKCIPIGSDRKESPPLGSAPLNKTNELTNLTFTLHNLYLKETFKHNLSNQTIGHKF